MDSEPVESDNLSQQRSPEGSVEDQPPSVVRHVGSLAITEKDLRAIPHPALSDTLAGGSEPIVLDTS